MLKKLIVLLCILFLVNSNANAWLREYKGIVEQSFTGKVSVVSEDVMGEETAYQSYVIILPTGQVILSVVGGEYGNKWFSQYVDKNVIITGRFKHTLLQGFLDVYQRHGNVSVEETQ